MKNILVIRFSSLGDVVLSTPIYRNLKAADPSLKITAAVKDRFAGVLENNPYVDKIMVLKEGESLFSFIGKVRRENFDTLIDLHNNLRSNIVAFLSGIPKVVRYRKAFLERRLFVKKRIRSGE